jgi:hypothetical protein
VGVVPIVVSSMDVVPVVVVSSVEVVPVVVISSVGVILFCRIQFSFVTYKIN